MSKIQSQLDQIKEFREIQKAKKRLIPSQFDDESEVRGIKTQPKEVKVVHQYKPGKNYIKLPVVRKVSPIKEETQMKQI